MYIFYPELGFTYEEKKYVALADFVDDLEEHPSDEIAKACGKLIANPVFLMWIYSLGYVDQVTEWMRVYEKVVW